MASRSDASQHTETRAVPTRGPVGASTDPQEPIEIPATWYTRFGKRAFDLVVATLLLALVAPLLVLAALIVRVSIGRPVFIKQFRVGQRSRPFEMRRLRTKRASRELDLRDPRASDDPAADPGADAATGVRVSFHRTAATGRVHRWRFDAVPQLINVVRGEMSLVGPQPLTWQDAVSARLLDHPRHALRPGLTGPAQLSRSSAASFDEQLALDCEYVEHIGLRRDLSLLIATLVSVFRR